MSTIPKIDPFKGDGWEECSAFIQAIRAAAWNEGKLRDPAWMADFASLYFSTKTLSWHSKLPLEVRQDWFKLEEALVNRWASGNQDVASPIQPVPAAAPKLVGGDVCHPVIHGVLKAVPDDGLVTPSYVRFDKSGTICALTKDKETALRLRLHSGSKPGLLEWMGAPLSSWLAIQWCKKEPIIGRVSDDWAILTVVSVDKWQAPWDREGRWQLMGCTVSPISELTPIWREAGNSKEIPLCVFLSQTGIYFTADPRRYAEENPREKRGKLVIERIA